MHDGIAAHSLMFTPERQTRVLPWSHATVLLIEDDDALSDEMSDEASPEPEEVSLMALMTSASVLFTAAVERGEDVARRGKDFAGWCLVCWWVEKAFRESGQVRRSTRLENSGSEL